MNTCLFAACNSLTLHTMLQWLSTLHLHHFDVIQTDLPINAETGQGHAYNLIQRLKREEQEVILNLHAYMHTYMHTCMCMHPMTPVDLEGHPDEGADGGVPIPLNT